MIHARLFFAAALAAGLWTTSAAAFPPCSSLPPPAPEKVCPLPNTHQVCVSSQRCTMPNSQPIVRQCYKAICSAGAPQNQPVRGNL